LGVSTPQQPPSASGGQQTVPESQVSGSKPAGQVIGSGVQVTLQRSFVKSQAALPPLPPANEKSTVSGFSSQESAQAARQASALAIPSGKQRIGSVWQVQ